MSAAPAPKGTCPFRSRMRRFLVMGSVCVCVCVCSDSCEAFGVGLGEAFDGGSGVSLVGCLVWS
ncbi:hypothetical protein K456DRAFT_79813 [Colletotrichum gloeosporioides 23]|nr:hypothetical protein K456DRAFT_79813 [Colletotrichum gloeosporioides 23]